MKVICGIYKITNPKGRIYIGQSIDCLRRQATYKRNSAHGQPRVENSIKKYGWDKHKFEVIHQCNPEELNDLEIYYIQLFQCFNSEHGLNLNSGGKRWIECSDETKRRITMALTGHKLSEETKEKIRRAHLGKKLSDEHKRKIGLAGIGRVFSQESRIKKSKSLKGRIITEEQRKRISESLKGFRHSPETRKKMSDSKKGKL